MIGRWEGYFKRKIRAVFQSTYIERLYILSPTHYKRNFSELVRAAIKVNNFAFDLKKYSTFSQRNWGIK